MEVVTGREWDRPTPDGEGDYGPFYEACAEGRLLIQECPKCAHRQFYPRPICTACGADPVWLETGATGTVHTYTIVRQYLAPPFSDELPYVVAVVDLPEGVRMLGTVTGLDPEEIQVGLEVEAYAVEYETGRAVPYWRPVTAG